MKAIYKCDLFILNTNLLDKYSDIIKMKGRQLFDLYSTLLIYSLSSNDNVKKISEDYTDYLIEKDIENKIFKEDIEKHFLMQISSDKNNDTTPPRNIPFSLDGRIYVTKTLIPNIVKEVITGEKFYVIDKNKMKLNKCIVIDGEESGQVLLRNEFKELKYYLVNKEAVSYWINLVKQYERKITSDLLEISKKEEKRRKEEIKKEHEDYLKEQAKINEEHKKRDDEIEEIKRLLKNNKE